MPRINQLVATPVGSGTLIAVRHNSLTGVLEAVVRFRLTEQTFDYASVGAL